MTGTIQQLDQAINQGQVSQAILLGEALHKASPGNQHVALSLSEAYRKAGQTRSAKATAQLAFEIDSTFPFAQAQYLRCLIPYADHMAMMAVLEKARSLSVTDPWCLQVCSDAAVAIDEWQIAGEFLNVLEEWGQGVQRAQAQYMRGVSYQVAGRNDAAIEKFRIAANASALAPRAYWSMVSVDTESVSFQELERLLNHSAVPAQDKRYLCQSLGQKYHKAGEYEQAFRCWQQANTLSQPMQAYRHQDWKHFFDQLQEGVKSAGPFTGQARQAASQPPVFIVGLPRSGSTLIEQLLVTSGRVKALGELRDLEVIIQESANKDIRPMPAKLEASDWKQVAQSNIADNYHQRISSRLQGDKIPCDKNPANMLWLGVILNAWPDAKIIHIHKSPQASCLGVYRQLFAAAAPWSYDLPDIAHYYQHCQSLLHYWDAEFPGRILDVSYESFVERPEEQGQRIYDYLGLDWCDQSLAGIGQQQGNIPTASTSQIREGLHAGYLRAWEPYKTQLEPFAKALS